MIRLVLAALLALLPAAAVAASSADLPHTSVALVAESASPAPGTPLTLGIVMTPKTGWHTYWLNPGDAGAPTRAAWTLPPGATAGELRYPTPGTLLVSGLMNHVYEEENVLLVDVKLPAGPAGTALPIKLKLDWLVCSHELCVPESATLDLALTTGDGARDLAQAARFDAARQALPRPLGSEGRYAVAGDRFRLSVPVAVDASAVHLFPVQDGPVDYAAAQSVTRRGDTLIVETKAGPDKPSGRLDFVLRVERAGQPPLGLSFAAVPGEVAAAGAPLAAASSSGDGDSGVVTPFLLAVLGGLILNIMPCVFPILSLKALSLARGGVSEGEARRDALSYTAGVVLTCTALGGAILALRAGGAAVGWAFQLQDPRVILALLLLTLAIGLNLAGLFELRGFGGGQALAEKRGAAGAFWTGALAAFVATPCTGPFMGAALGAALALPTLGGLAVFAGLGLGLALPFLAIGLVPALRKRLPRPGAWMDVLRRILALPMLLTAVALAWVLGRQAGVDGMALGLVAALSVGALLWWFGRRQLRDTAHPALGPLIGILLVTGLAALALDRAPAQASTSSTSTLAAQPFTEAKLAELRAARTPAFVYFTADWCITCKVNEHGAMASPRVAEAFKAAGVQVLVGDWTDGDATIGRFLDAHGRAGVPLYLFYGADGRSDILPQLLTPDMLVALATRRPA